MSCYLDAVKIGDFSYYTVRSEIIARFLKRYMEDWLYICTKFQKHISPTIVPFYNWVCFQKSDVWSLYSQWICEDIEFEKNVDTKSVLCTPS